MVAKLPGEIIKMKYIKYERGWTGEHSSFEILDSFLVKEWENQRALKMLPSVDTASKSGDKKCFSCGKTGHLSKSCPVTNEKSKKSSSLVNSCVKALIACPACSGQHTFSSKQGVKLYKTRLSSCNTFRSFKAEEAANLMEKVNG